VEMTVICYMHLDIQNMGLGLVPFFLGAGYCNSPF
jgi:hypothetical protein